MDSAAIAGTSIVRAASHEIALTTTGFARTELTPGGYTFRSNVECDLNLGTATDSVAVTIPTRTAGAAIPTTNRTVRLQALVDYPITVTVDARYLSARCTSGTGTLTVNGPYTLDGSRGG